MQAARGQAGIAGPRAAAAIPHGIEPSNRSGDTLNISRLALGAAMLAALGAGAGHAQTTPLIIDQQRTDRKLPEIPGRARAPSSPLAPEVAAKIAPFTLRAVQVSGASVPPELLKDAAAPFIGRTVDAAAIKAIAEAMSDAYANSDIALYTIVVPEQSFADGVLQVVAVEGYVEHVDLEGDVTGDLDLIKAYAAKLAAERPATRATFQRYVSLIRDIPGLTPDIQLVQGSARGAVRMIVTLHQKRFALDLSVNNSGSAVLGRTQFEADATAYDLFQQGEQTTLTFAMPTTPSRFQYVALADTEPLDDDGTLAKASFGYLHTRPRFAAFDGHAEVLQLLVGHPLIRSYDENLSLNGSFDGIDSVNAILGELPANERVRTLRLSAGYSRLYTTDSLLVSGTLSQGIDALGARVNPGLAVADFTKLNVQGAFYQLIGTDFVVRLRATAQYAANPLPTSELFALGGQDFARAFTAATLTGDQAIAGSLELGWHPQAFPIAAITGTEIYGFVDGGETWLRRRGGVSFPAEGLMSAGGGVRIPFGENSEIQLEAARQVDVPAFVTPHPGWVFNFAIRRRF